MGLVRGPNAAMISGALNAAVNGGNIVEGMVTGCLSASFSQLGLLGAGIYGGFMSYSQGVSFMRGFVSAGISQLGGGDGIPGFVTSTILGGVASRITGGKFESGAASAAFMYVMRVGAQKISVGGALKVRMRVVVVI